MKLLIVGNGIVGKNMKKLFLEADIHDPPQGILCDLNEIYDIAFICVPTPCEENGECKTSIVVDAILSVKARIYCVRSTVPPGTCSEIALTYNRAVVFMPEYTGETIHANGYNYDFIILGGDRGDTGKIAEAFKEISTGELKIFQTTFETAELCKLMENCFLATKVTFCNEFYRIALRIGVDYNELREMFIADPRVGRSHTFVYDEHPFYQSKCLDKDIPIFNAFAKQLGTNTPFMTSVYIVNDMHKKDIKHA
jgi:UDPglucose 6-dehydrogenase